MKLHTGDCLSILPQIEPNSIDLVLTDPPFEITAHKWDHLVNVDALWAHFRRILKPNAAVVMFAVQPFATKLILSNPTWFKYEWIWVKYKATNFAHAKNKPMRAHANILMFRGGATRFTKVSPPIV